MNGQQNKTYRTALIGSGWWGTNILREAAASGRCKIVALVDVDKRQLAKCARGGGEVDERRAEAV